MPQDQHYVAMEGPATTFQESRSPVIIRNLSREVTLHVANPLGDAVTPTTAVIFMLNSLSGTSILTLPYSWNESGILLGSLVLIASASMAYITVTYVCEALSIANAIHFEQVESTFVGGNPALQQELHREREAQLQSQAPSVEVTHGNTIEDFSKEVRFLHPEREFRIRERVELGAMGERVLHSKATSTVLYAVILVMTYGTLSVFVVLINTSLAHLVCNVLARVGVVLAASQVYPVCVLVIFAFELPLCLSDLQKTKRFTQAIMLLKFLAILTLVTVSTVYAMGHIMSGTWTAALSKVPLWKTAGFPAAFGNSVFLFAVHHLVPSIAGPVQPQEKAPKVIGTGFCIICLFILVVNTTALVAWSGEHYATCSTRPGGHFCKIMPMYNLNFEPLAWLGGVIGDFIVAYPVLGIANLPVTAITTRNTLGKVLGLSPPDPAKPLTPKNIIMVLLVLVPPFGVALITKDVQVVIKYVGGYAGLVVAYVIPLVLVVRGRRVLSLEGGKAAELPRPLKSPYACTAGYATVVAFASYAFAFITRENFFVS